MQLKKLWKVEVMKELDGQEPGKLIFGLDLEMEIMHINYLKIL